MSEDSAQVAAELETKLAAKDEKIETLDTKLRQAVRDGAENINDLSDLKTEKATVDLELQAAQNTNTRLKRENEELQARLSQDADKKLAVHILELSKTCVNAGFTSAFFEGVETNPIAWFKAKGFSDIKTLEELSLSAPATATTTATSSGKADEATDDAAVELSDADKAEMKRLGLDPELAELENADDLRVLRDKESDSK